MPVNSLFPPLSITPANILTHLFPPNYKLSEKPLWIESTDTSKYLSQHTLLQLTKQFVFGLRRLSVKPGEVVMILSPNHIFVPVAYFGAMGCGAVFSGANPAYTVSELVHPLKDTGASILLVHPDLLETAIAATELVGMPKERIFQFSDVENSTKLGVKDWWSLLGSPQEAATVTWTQFNAEQSRRTVATLNYSSGTTGLPKGVCTAHSSLIANLEQAIFMRQHGQKNRGLPTDIERWIGFLPLYHAFGQLFSILVACRLNVPVYVMKTFQFEQFLRVIASFKITHLQTAPPVMVMMNKRLETARYDLSSLKNILCGAAPLSKELQNAVSKQLGVTVNQIWGMTELTCAAIQVPGGMIDDSGSVGMLFPNVQAKLVDDDGREVGVNHPGELYVRGPNVCLRYWRNDKATRESLDPEGWLKTGDVAVINERGMFWIVDRKKELIKVNGLQVAPAELEGILLKHKSVSDAAVVGIAMSGEEFPRGYVVPKANGECTELEIKEWIESRVAKHKRLRGGLVFVPEVPKLASGKIARKVMKEWAQRDAVELTQKQETSSFKSRL